MIDAKKVPATDTVLKLLEASMIAREGAAYEAGYDTGFAAGRKITAPEPLVVTPPAALPITLELGVLLDRVMMLRFTIGESDTRREQIDVIARDLRAVLDMVEEQARGR